MTRPSTPTFATMLFVVAALLIGGSASQGLLAAATLQLTATVAIAFAMLRDRQPLSEGQRGLALVGAAAVAVALVQLLPLPAALWTALPGRSVLAQSLALAGAGDRWHAISLAPDRTLAALVALLPPVAAALAGMRVSKRGLGVIGWGIALVLLASVAMGLAQRAGGGDSPFYLYAVTNRTEAVGFFANSNHFGSFCAVTLPLLTALFVARRGAAKLDQRWAVLGVLLLIGIGGAVLSRSLAAIGLCLPALAAVVMIARLGRSRAMARRSAASAVLGLAVVAVLAMGMLVWLDLGTGTGPGADMSRAGLWPRTLSAALHLLPLGGGLGTFRVVYPGFEDAQVVTAIFANHAHNDYLELVMDAGLLGVALVAIFGWWWLRAARTILRASERDAWREAALAVTALLLLHEIVDYPLRTPALAVLFGLCCGIMVRGAVAPAAEGKPAREGRHLAA